MEKDHILSYPQGIPQLLAEIRAHWTLELCEGVLKLFEIFETSAFIVLVLEYQPGGNLLQLLEDQFKFTEESARVLMG